MTSLPEWLVERAALDEVPAASRERIDRADAGELATRISELRDANARELERFPAAPAVAQIEARVSAERRTREARRRRVRAAVLGVASTCVAAVLVVYFAGAHAPAPASAPAPNDDVRVKGPARLIVFRQVGERAERLDADALVHAGDVIQLRYNAGGRHYGVIASVDGAGAVTLHFPSREDAPPEATAVAADTTTLPDAFALDDAPRFERFFFITSNDPIDLSTSLAALHALAQRADSADAELVLPGGLSQWSLRLRKP